MTYYYSKCVKLSTTIDDHCNYVRDTVNMSANTVKMWRDSITVHIPRTIEYSARGGIHEKDKDGNKTTMVEAPFLR